MESQLVSNVEKLEKLFGSRMREYEEKLSKATTSGVSSHPDLASLSREFSDFQALIWESLTALRSQIELLTLGLDRHETAMRRKVLLFHGVTEKPNEKILDVVHSVITNQLKVTDISRDHLQVCHRLGSSQAKNRPILVRFFNLEQRHLVWDSKTELKGTGITVTEFLTKMRHKVFMAARSHFGINQCWTVEGKITVILPDKTRRKIESASDLDRLISQFPLSNERAGNAQGPSSPKLAASKPVSNPSKKKKKP